MYNANGHTDLCGYQQNALENPPQGSKRTGEEKYRKIKEASAMIILSCAFNIDTACVELNYLIYNEPVAYAELILNGDPEISL